MVLDRFNFPDSIRSDVDQKFIKEVIGDLSLHSSILSRLARCYSFSTNTKDNFHYQNNLPAIALLDPETDQTVSDFISFVASLRLQENPNANPDDIRSELYNLTNTFPPGSKSRHLLLSEFNRSGKNIIKIFEDIGLQSRELAELGLDGPDLDDQVSKFTTLPNFSQQVLKHVNRVIAMNQDAINILEMDHYLPKIETVPVGNFFDQYFVDLLAETRANFRYHPNPQLEGRLVRMDKKIVTKTLDNLMSNMTKYGLVNSKGDKIDRSPVVKIGSRHGRLLIIFRDFGVGIDPQYVKRFNQNIIPGRMVSNTKIDGNGFGLYGCRLLLAEIGSSLKAKSVGLDHGSTFTLSLPLEPSPSV